MFIDVQEPAYGWMYKYSSTTYHVLYNKYLSDAISHLPCLANEGVDQPECEARYLCVVANNGMKAMKIRLMQDRNLEACHSSLILMPQFRYFMACHSSHASSL